MNSPFPGMDPYLEDPRIWPNVHHGVISQMQRVLNETLRPRYFVRVEERIYVSDETDPGRRVLVPDLQVAATKRAQTANRGPSDSRGLAIAEPVVLTTLLDEEIHESHLRIVDAQGKTVVAVIEVLSPANKVAGARGRASYIEKRAEMMRSQSHWMEIDLLRSGEPIVARETLPEGDYFVHVSRVQKRPRGYVWPIRLEERLPVVGVPLGGGDPDAPLDLQAVLDAAYKNGAYDLEVDYRREPSPPLSEGQRAWAEMLLRQKSLR